VTTKKLLLYSALAAFNVYVLWPAPSASKVYRSQVSSVVKISRFEKPVMELETPFGIFRMKFPWGCHYGHGSGVIISKKGHILTAGHVTKGSGLFLITTRGGQIYEAGLLGVDRDADLAILQPVRGSPRGFTVAYAYPTADVGDSVVHIGCPLGFNWLLTQGVVSLVYRYLVISDTVINPGSSGGALFDIRGRLIGIASGLVTPIDAYIGHSVFVGPEEVTRFLDAWEVVTCH
jgi:S1-C subfamily serine protease